LASCVWEVGARPPHTAIATSWRLLRPPALPDASSAIGRHAVPCARVTAPHRCASEAPCYVPEATPCASAYAHSPHHAGAVPRHIVRSSHPLCPALDVELSCASHRAATLKCGPTRRQPPRLGLVAPPRLTPHRLARSHMSLNSGEERETDRTREREVRLDNERGNKRTREEEEIRREEKKEKKKEKKDYQQFTNYIDNYIN
jgi:hypothetical protein